MTFVANSTNNDALNAAFGKGNESNIGGIGRQMAMYLKFKDDTNTTLQNNISQYNTLAEVLANQKANIATNDTLMSLIKASDYAYGIWNNTKIGKEDFILYDMSTGFNSIVGSPSKTDNRITLETSTTNGFTVTAKVAASTGSFTGNAKYPVDLSTLVNNGDIYLYKNLKVQLTSNSRSSTSATLNLAVLGKTIFNVGSVDNGLLTFDYSEILKTIGTSSYITPTYSIEAGDSNTQYAATFTISKIWLTEDD